MGIRLKTSKKDQICRECGNKIPAGDKYWSGYTHMNCADYEKNIVTERGITQMQRDLIAFNNACGIDNG